MANARTSWPAPMVSLGFAAFRSLLYPGDENLCRRKRPTARRRRARRRAKQQTRLWMRSIFAVYHTKPYRALLIYLPFCLMIFLLQPDLVFSKGGGAGGSSTASSGGGGYYGGGGGSSSSNTRWVFWYTGSGSRTCGNYCIITFSVIGAVILAIIACGVYRCVRICRDSKKEDLENSINFGKRQQYNYLTPSNEQYPPLPPPSPTLEQSTSLPPDYEATSPAPEPVHVFGKYGDAHRIEESAAEDYTRRYPPKEELPPVEHQEYIRTQGGVRAWQMIANPSRGVQVTDHGRTVCFSAKNDAMVQANYPMFTPEGKPKIDTTAHLNTDTKQEYDQPNSPGSSDSCNEIPSPATDNSRLLPVVVESAPPYSLHNGPANKSLASDEQISSKRRSRSIDDDSKIDLDTDEFYYYFEITVKEKPNPRNTAIAIGLATKPYPEFRLPGWNKHSVGYHSDDGYKFCNDSFGGRDYGEDSEWRRVGDTVGCGYNPTTGFVFFTKNGKYLGTAFTGQRHVYFPTVGADGPCTIEVNFGEREFTFEKAQGHSVTVAR